MRVLLIGANGMLGKDIVREWTGDELIPATSRDADIRNPEEVERLIAATCPEWILLTAAYTDVDGSEGDHDAAFAVNHRGTENVARMAAKYGAKVLYMSTDYVFDGNGTRPYEPADPIGPIGVYGASKAAGEKAIQGYLKDWCIVRTSWLFGASGQSFPEKILHAAETRPELSVVSDQIGSPTFTRDLAGAMQSLVRADARGFISVTNAGTCSWFEFASEILRQAGKTNTVKPINTVQAARAAKRPAYSVLSPAALHAFGIKVRHWREALPPYLEELRQMGKLK
ncbi:MAG: dTDP-4-dehydrorhamnose reductase [Acidobacteriota bacterium]|nr:dTDP-4-dehydrorhamnose reductase [Acidobacteriota bacterium]